EETAAQAGCLAGAQGTIVVSTNCFENQKMTSIKMLDCSTSEIYWAATGFNSSATEIVDVIKVNIE
ncbi:MAG: hypothetical protein VXY58_07660, partial [Bacteroidota bacterium]|nr:hypothetical protein [Bacteroidota bacterium]